jgi:hypothetical protein
MTALAGGVMAIVRALVATVLLTATVARAQEAEWTVILRGDTPKNWCKDVGNPNDANGYAVKTAPAGVQFLRVRRMDTKEAVIIPMTNTLLTVSQPIGGNKDFWWTGAVNTRGPDNDEKKILGIANVKWPAMKRGQHLVRRSSKHSQGWRGWGFSREAGGASDAQTYSWAGNPIEKTVFEVAVKTSALTADERKLLLDEFVNVAQATAARIVRPQSSIHALYVTIAESGQLLGLSSELIITATAGDAPGGRLKVQFTTKAGDEMHMVLDDVVRAIGVQYPNIGASKIELSFADKYTPKDGGSIGAAIGTLILSIIQGFEVDPELAITGDVTADGKLRQIGGVAAKIRGATAAGCNIVALPTENYDQVVDAMVYEGLPLITNSQVIGVAKLEDAAAVARLDRDEKLKQAMTLFGELQESLKKSPARLTSKDVSTKLATIVDLVPNHYSAKLLHLASQDKQPRRLSATATKYYTFVAVNDVAPIVFERADAKAKQPPSTVVQEGLRKLDRIARIADPQVMPLVTAWRNFIRELNDVQTSNASRANLRMRAQAVLDAMAKLSTDRDLMEKMLKEGV